MRGLERVIAKRAESERTQERLCSLISELEDLKGGPTAAAESLGVSRVALHRWKTGKDRPTRSHWNLIELTIRMAVRPATVVNGG